MATLYKTTQSRFWFARYYDGAGKRQSRSTKTESKRDAKVIAGRFEDEARKEAAKVRQDSEIPALIRRTVEIASLEMQHGTLTLQRAEELIRQMHQAANPHDAGINFKRFAGAWLDAKEKTTETTTWRSYRDAIKAATTIFGTKADGPMRDITVGDCERLQSKLSETLRGKTTNYYVSVIRRILESAVQKDIITKNPAKPVVAVGQGDSRKRAPFSADEVKRILAQARDAEWYGIILLAAHTGLRCGDLLKLTSENMVEKKLQIQPHKGAKKSGDVLEIPLTPECVSWLEGRVGDLFPEIKRLKPTAVSSHFKSIMRKAKVPKTVILAAGDPPVIAHRSFHSLRHSFNSWLAEADIPSDVRRKLTGHRSEAVHQRYTHHDKALVRAVETLPSL